jgi:hypothetical protein
MTRSQPATEAGRLHVSWEELDRLVAALAGGITGPHDLLLAVTRGGLIPAGMLAYRGRSCTRRRSASPVRSVLDQFGPLPQPE